MSQPPTLDEILDVKRRYIDAFRAWLSVPDRIIKLRIAQEEPPRKLIYVQLVEVWSKLHQDMSAGLHLVGGNYIGTSLVVCRVCRENALRMVLWAFSDAGEDQIHLHNFQDVQPKNEARRLKKDMQAFLDSPDFPILPDEVQKQIAAAITYAESTMQNQDSFPCDEVAETKTKGFAALAHLTASRLQQAGIEPSIIPVMVRDYWMESEAVHTGVNSRPLYEPNDVKLGTERNGQITCLLRLGDLYSITPLITISLIYSANLQEKYQRAKESIDLSKVAKEAETIVHQVSSACDQP